MDDLHGTLLWREGVERHLACTYHEALVIAVAAHPQLVLVEGDLPQAERLLRHLRRGRSTRRISIAAMVRGEAGPSEVDLLAAGANAVLKLPVSPEWDERLARLIDVPGRRQARLPVRVDFVAFAAHDAVQRVSGTTVDISATGMAIECQAPIPLGADLDLRFRLPGCEVDVVGCGRVVRQASRGRYGVQFYALEGDGTAIVAAFVSARPKGDSGGPRTG